jgi:hypothetical protein
MDTSFFHLAMEQAWKAYSILPHKALTKTNGETQCQFTVYTGRLASASTFRVMFCPVVFTYDNIVVSRGHAKRNTVGTKGANQPRLETLNRKNNPQREMIGVEASLRVFEMYSSAFSLPKWI